jgi:hypothetical protein
LGFLENAYGKENKTRVEGRAPVLRVPLPRAWNNGRLYTRVQTDPKMPNLPVKQLLRIIDQYFIAKTVKYSHYEEHAEAQG